MLLEVYDCPMISSAARKWVEFGDDERAALNYALNDAILRTQHVAEYRYRVIRLRRGIAHVHRFRIGHAIIEIAIFRNYPAIITDIGWIS